MVGGKTNTAIISHLKNDESSLVSPLSDLYFAPLSSLLSALNDVSRGWDVVQPPPGLRPALPAQPLPGLQAPACRLPRHGVQPAGGPPSDCFRSAHLIRGK